jgi:hypothetical protein
LGEQQQAYDRAAAINHPDVHNTGTIDCASCHLATPARAAAAKRLPLSPSATAFLSERHDLSTTTVFDNPQFIHALAWRDTDLAVNERVINESARSADVADAWLTQQGVLR